MSQINVSIGEKENVFEDSDRLLKGLRHNVKSTKTFIEAINNFLNEFNKRYKTNVNFEQVLDIYEDKNTLGFYQTLILCKALLDFIQNNGMVINFEGTANIVKYSTLAHSNVTLEFDPNTVLDMDTFYNLSLTISGFINRVREQLKTILRDNIDLSGFSNLSDSNIDSYFIDNSKNPEFKRDIDGSVMIHGDLILPYDIDDERLVTRISVLDNESLRSFFDYIYNNIPDEEKTTSKSEDLVRKIGLVEHSNNRNFINSIKEIFNEEEKTLNITTINKFDIDKMRYYLFGLKVKKIESVEEKTPEELMLEEEKSKILQLQNQKVSIDGSRLLFPDGTEIDLNNNNYFKKISELSPISVQKFFLFLEENTMKVFNFKKNGIITKLISEIGISEENTMAIRQKITNIRKSPSIITQKFLDNNIDLNELRDLISKFNKIEEELSEEIDLDQMNGDLANKELDSSDEVNIILSGNKLIFSDGIEINLEDSNYFKNISKLSTINAQRFFSYLEENTMEVFSLTKSRVITKLVSEIEVSEENTMTIRQKITNIRKKPSKITPKFLKNIDSNKLKELILSFAEEEEESTEEDIVEDKTLNNPGEGETQNDILKNNNKGGSFDITFYDELSEENIIINVEHNGYKNIEGFIFSLNIFISNYLKTIDDSMEEFKVEDFKGISLDSDFFYNLKIRGNEFGHLFEILNEEILNEFLIKWHGEIGKRIKQPKEKYIKPGSNEEVEDFFNFLRKKINKDLIKQRRKGGSTSNNKSKKKINDLKITDEMINEFEEITLDLFTNISAKDKGWKGIFARYNKNELEEIIMEYLEKRKEINGKFKKTSN